jgi:threonyl-tRNA synthetase
MSNNLEKIRHSLSHLMAQAVQEFYPEAKLAIGPVIDNGFYYDFDLTQTISATDLPKIAKRMKKLISQNISFQRLEKTPAEAKELSKNQPYKLELLNELIAGKKPITYYQSDKFIDLCAGPHVASTKEINPEAFRLTSVAGAYWRGDEKNKMLQRIYGVAFATRAELDEYLKMQELAQKNDHRKLGQELDLFVFSDLVGKGLPLLTSKGSTIRRELERFIIDEEIKWGYQHVITPPLAKTELYKVSGHYPYYKNTMYPPMKVDEEELILRPMTCPHHFMLYKNKPHSYRELPLRLAELSPQFRYEKSGELTGLMRVRLFCLADAHIFCTQSQAASEIAQVLKLIDFVNKTLGLKKGQDYFYRLSLGDPDDTKKYYQDNKAWEYAENVLRQVLQKSKAPFYEARGEAAFYGPKIDVQMKRLNGQEDTAFTVQYDFVMPKRFNLRYTDNHGQELEPVVIHRSSIGAFERTMAFLIEHYAGAFPVWLSPVQVEVITVGKAHKKFAKKLHEQLSGVGIRSELNDSNETVGYKIRSCEKRKLPYMLVIGDKEVKGKTLNVRLRGLKAIKKMTVKSFMSRVLKEIEEKK